MRMYYGNPSASDVQDIEGTYDGNFSGVWHLNETSGTHYDATSNNNDGSPQNGVVQNSQGRIDGADDFDGTNDYVNCGDSGSLDITTAITIEAWVYPNGTDHSGTDLNVVHKYANNDRSYVLYLNDDAGGDDWDFKLSTTGGGTNGQVHVSNAVDSNAWQYMTATWDGTDMRLYKNGAEIGTATYSGPIYQSATELWIGDGTYYDAFDGRIDEVRISNKSRSADWISAQYLSMTDDFITFSGEEDGKRGMVYLFMGDGSIPTSAENADRKIWGEAQGDQFGFSISNAGDVDNNGKDDVIIGAPFNDDIGADAGKAYIFNFSDKYFYVNSNTTTYGVINAFDSVKSASDGGAYAVLFEGSSGYPGGNEYLYVDGFGSERTAWVEVGISPYLNAVDGVNRVYTASDNAEEGDFTFSDSSVSGAFSSSQIELYSYQAGAAETIDVYIHDGTSWNNMGSITPAAGYSWLSIDTSSVLDTKAKIDVAKLYVVYQKSGPSHTVSLDASRIYWSATSTLLYQMDIEFNTTDVPLVDENYLQLNYSVDGSETDFGVLVYNGTTEDWDDFSAQGDLSSTTFTTKEYTLDPDHILGSGYVRTKFIGRNETSDQVNSTINIEYFRIKSVASNLGLLGETAGDNFGWSTNNASEINEDGSYDDVIVGAPGYSTDKGRAYIFHGGSPMDAISDVNLTGENNNDMFAYSVSSAGDIDGDGVPDVIIGVPYWDNGATTDCGQILVFKGGSAMDTTSDYLHNGTQANEHYGWSVSFALNIEGGSTNAVVVGAPHYDSGTDSGLAEVLNAFVIPEYSTAFVPVTIVIALFFMGRVTCYSKKKGKNSTKKIKRER
jgi:hypothetical protein